MFPFWEEVCSIPCPLFLEMIVTVDDRFFFLNTSAWENYDLVTCVKLSALNHY